MNPTAEQFYVLDRAQGFIQVIAREAQDYREMGFPILDGYGNRVTDFDAAHQAAIVRHAEPDQAAAFYAQFDEVWELIEMEEAMAELVLTSLSITVSLHVVLTSHVTDDTLKTSRSVAGTRRRRMPSSLPRVLPRSSVSLKAHHSKRFSTLDTDKRDPLGSPGASGAGAASSAPVAAA